MAAPVFLSSRWRDGSPRAEVDELDRQLRLRGVPIWRDVRELGAGGVNEDAAWRALTEECCGAVLYLSDDLFESWFISSVELKAIRHRLARDRDFFVAVVFDGVDGVTIERLQRESGVDAKAFQGLFLARGRAAVEQLRPFAGDLLHRYLSRCQAPITITVATREAIPLSDEALLHLNWDTLLGGDTTGGTVDTGGELKRAVADVRARLEARFAKRELILGGRMHLSAAFLIGWEFREPTGWTVLADHRRAAVRTEMVEADEQGWSLVLSPTQNDSEVLVIQVAIAQDPSEAVLTHRGGKPPARAQLAVIPPGGSPSKVSLADTDSNGLGAAVVAAVQEARARFGVCRSDLYLATPWAFAVQLGWMFGSLGEVAVFEATADKTTYYDDPIVLP
jgi:SMODS-associated and fused to various effectors sensor domain